jgi:hypothetical protein
MAFRPSEARRAGPGIASRPSCVQPALGLPSRGRASGASPDLSPRAPISRIDTSVEDGWRGSLADEVALLICEAAAAIDVLLEIKASPGYPRYARRMLHARAGQCYTPERKYTAPLSLSRRGKCEVVRRRLSGHRAAVRPHNSFVVIIQHLETGSKARGRDYAPETFRWHAECRVASWGGRAS